MIVCMQRQVRLKCFQFQRSWFSSILNPISDDIGVLVQRHATPHCTLVEEDVCTILVAGNCRAVGWRLELSLYSFLIWMHSKFSCWCNVGRCIDPTLFMSKSFIHSIISHTSTLSPEPDSFSRFGCGLLWCSFVHRTLFTSEFNISIYQHAQSLTYLVMASWVYWSLQPWSKNFAWRPLMRFRCN